MSAWTMFFMVFLQASGEIGPQIVPYQPPYICFLIYYSLYYGHLSSMFRLVVGSVQPAVRWVSSVFPGYKADHLFLSGAKVKIAGNTSTSSHVFMAWCLVD
jgi:hypothetical protein